MRLLFLTGSRGEWGYIRPILRMCAERGHMYRICATNMHLLPGHGFVDIIRRDQSPEAVAETLACFIEHA